MKLPAALVILGLFSHSAFATYAVVYELGDNTKPLFHLNRSQVKRADGGVTTNSEFKTVEGVSFAQEKIEQTGTAFESYSLKLPLLGESADVVVKDGKIHMVYRTKDGEKSDTEDWKPNYVIAPTLVDYIHAHWDTLQAGKSVDVKMIVPDRVDSFSFEFVKDGTQVYRDKTVDRILFKPTSFFVSLVVKPVTFLFDPSNRKILSIAGRTLLKKKTANGWEDFLAENVFTQEGQAK